MNPTTIKGKNNPRDLYRTPYFVTRSLMAKAEEFRTARCYDPCAGYGDIVKQIGLCGGLCEGSDIFPENQSISQMDYREAVDKIKMEGLAVVTNPPYSLIDDFLEVMFPASRRMALLLPIDYISVQKRSHYFNYLYKWIILDLRMNLTHWRGGERADFGAKTYGWYIFDNSKVADKIETYRVKATQFQFRRVAKKSR